MSFTAAYSELFALDINAGELTDENPRILDREGFESVHERVDVSESTFLSSAITAEETDDSEYPPKTWTILKGFKSFTPADAFLLAHDPDRDALVSKIENHEDRSSAPLGYTYNIENVGIPRGGMEGAWKTLFAEVSRHTEPFAFYHSPVKHAFPDVTDFADGTSSVYYVECEDGDVYAEEQAFARVDCGKLIQERERTADHRYASDHEYTDDSREVGR